MVVVGLRRWYSNGSSGWWVNQDQEIAPLSSVHVGAYELFQLVATLQLTLLILTIRLSPQDQNQEGFGVVSDLS